MKVLICGSSVLLGSNCMEVFKKDGMEVIGTYFSYPQDGLMQLDTLDLKEEQILQINEFAPDVVMHCGALTHVDYCEDHVDESYQKTVTSTKNLIQIANNVNAKFVFISTDYVFDGKNGPYIETDPVNPLSVYGKHKLEAENEVRQSSSSYLIFRITNVYGKEARNKNFVSRIVEQAESNDKMVLKLPFDQFATPTNARDLARAISLILKNNLEGLFHLSSIEYMNRVDLAWEVLKHYPQADYTLEALSTESLNQKAPRPLRGGLQRLKFTEAFPEFKWTTVSDFVNSTLQNRE